MKYLFNIFLLSVACFTFKSCNTATPETYFDQAVLNSNMLVGFATNGFSRQLDAPSSKLEPSTGKTLPVSRKELIEEKVKWVEESFAKINDLAETPDTKEMLQSSKALYEYVLPVYKTEYMQLAGLYDEGAAQDKIDASLKALNDKYSKGFNERYDKLISIGKGYAAKHSIKVNWGVGG
jgi:hypothetical protein